MRVAPMCPRRRRREFDGCCSACGQEEKHTGRPCRSGIAQFRRNDAEEINRLITDRLSDALYTTEAEAEANLRREGVDPLRIVFVGNVMIDSLLRCLPRAKPFEKTMREAGAWDSFLARSRSGYAVTTLHRPSNVDDPSTLGPLFHALAEISTELPIVFPAHPRTQRLVAQSAGRASSRVRRTPDTAGGLFGDDGLMRSARLVITDSGGMQEETTGLGVPCLTLRTSTERPITIIHGTNTLVGVTAGAGCLGGTRHSGDWRKGRPYPAAVGWQGRQEDRCRSRHSISVNITGDGLIARIRRRAQDIAKGID